MKHFVSFAACSFVALLAAARSAGADAYFVSAGVPGAYTVEATFPNQKVEKRTLDATTSSSDREYFLLPPGADKLGIVIRDDAGDVAWKGTVGKDDLTLIVPSKAGIKVQFAGIYAGSGSPRGELFMNLTGESLTIDLAGGNGIAATRGISVPSEFDAKKLVKLDPREATYEVIGKIKGKDDIEFSGKVSAFHYCLLWKTDQGVYRAEELGTIPPPPKKKK